MIRTLHTLSLAPDVNSWLKNSQKPRILHVFDTACNLVNQHKEVLSVVAPQIGNGPFNLIIQEDICFSEYLSLETPVSNSANQLQLGDLIINTTHANLWSPQPDWQRLHTKREHILKQITSLPITNYQPLLPNSLLSDLSSAIAQLDIPDSIAAAKQLAGLGQGLTPAGDDFMMGVIHAAWIIHPPEVAEHLAEEISHIATQLTTSLSAAWLRAAGKGQAGALWHDFFAALLSAQPMNIQETMEKILAVGETSGADALAGFFSTFDHWAKRTGSRPH